VAYNAKTPEVTSVLSLTLLQGCKRDVAVETETRPRLLLLSLRRDRDLPKFSRDRDETETFDLGSETETETDTFRNETETFLETLHTSELYRPLCLSRRWPVQFTHLFFTTGKKTSHKFLAFYQEFTYHIFSNQIEQLSLTSTAPELWV